jgi:hypothetical protein
MPADFNDHRSRSELRAKRRKTNLILNTLIAIVIILILIVGGRIFFGGDNPNEQDVAAVQPKSEKPSPQEDSSEPKPSSKENDDADDNEEDQAEEDGELIEKESDEPNVEKVIIDPNWEPVGTEQANGHQSSFTEGTVDWNEKLKAVSYAAGIPQDNMILWWIEGGQDRQNEAIATVSARGSDDTYRVYIQWVDGEGWKPVEVKKLIHNDKK